MKRGTQIVYIPQHAEGSHAHPDVETGFVTSVKEYGAFCRFWSKTNPDELRTKANSEFVAFRHLEETNTVPQWRVNELLKELP